MSFSDFIRSGNLAIDPATYELENDAIARDGRLDHALAELAPQEGRTLLDVGCGNGYWLARYATDAAAVIGVEPDPDLRAAAQSRVAGLDRIEVLAGSAEQLPLPDSSVDVAHARFAYFFGAGAEKGLEEVRRVLRPGGVFAAIDNDWGWGEFADLLRLGSTGASTIDPVQTDAWWAEQGATRTAVKAGWKANSPTELERILRIEFAADVVDAFLASRTPSADISYGVAIFTIQS